MAIAKILSVLAYMTGCGVHYNGKISDHFDGSHYSNGKEADTIEGYTLIERLRWMRSTKLVEWPEWIEDPVYAAPRKEVALGELRVTHINHATVLIQVDGVNILTDPIWSDRASMVSWAGPKRVRSPGVDMKDLPRIDVIVISHNHYDHLDIATLRQLTKNNNPKIIVGLGVRELLVSEGFDAVTELDWWQTYDALPNALKVVFVPARHGSGRGLFDRNKTLWGGFVIESIAGNVYFAGDTAYGDFLADIKKKFGEFRLALLPIGHYEPRWMMESVHMSPEDAVKLHRYLNVRQSMGMHFATFHGMGAHNNEKVDQHEKDLRAALYKYSVPESEFWLLGFGEGRRVGGARNGSRHTETVLEIKQK